MAAASRVPIRITRYDPTPNPNALKCWVQPRVSVGPRSFLNEAMAAGDPLAAALFRDAGLTTLLLNGDWMTINKRPEDGWPAVKAAVERILAAPPGDRDG